MDCAWLVAPDARVGGERAEHYRLLCAGHRARWSNRRRDYERLFAPRVDRLDDRAAIAVQTLAPAYLRRCPCADGRDGYDRVDQGRLLLGAGCFAAGGGCIFLRDALMPYPGFGHRVFANAVGLSCGGPGVGGDGCDGAIL